MITTYIGVGSNIERKKHVQAALSELRELGEQIRISTVYECASVGFESRPFYNLVVEMKTSLSLSSLSSTLREIEIRWGRDPDAQKMQDRTLDLDIVLYGDVVSSKPSLPREDIYKYAFVIQPMYELCPELVIPNDGRTVTQIRQTMNNFDSLIAVNPFDSDVSK
ncbi:putative 2-amino-4-hydroxy-6-hydroxymethyldihydropteridine pyrophosphokinase [Vibrio nigripulchritudo MADA3029]|uniref:2-amino-4-hydroxy-6- hydroxymethyldihydropteridine diphosphokinase n=1 Tax=Vibrio nigripulchritudo TaxID=28173 RepID=UPI0003B18F9E|nr:2-amino-4-hydroxy-6-hydroxymethyldihydropteridine diphosphokinase [Vibrio nigripulchritudo]CCN45174.1 putative 2-amino-4-hydroxy-6-hydroxymethyldihydropteridine pyrophosphokinase [Vibrio nigripulchritudo MADA3020]CCN54512.1 putative 2-amino-4-hydroxy-6-hydroxymethyldihydropteridine pyrophosphokinase [Vibrio nigripulchritudo MADA3021]CCN57562.1 putative 2-amino-4-hydroxy-6-hydroxymethyldihydropteridine pyrophosphokinase [Vibrio nigripulchritudo MADA3029]CCN72462.1 putative 2-amino-4-hydroxy-6